MSSWLLCCKGLLQSRRRSAREKEYNIYQKVYKWNEVESLFINKLRLYNVFIISNEEKELRIYI